MNTERRRRCGLALLVMLLMAGHPAFAQEGGSGPAAVPSGAEPAPPVAGQDPKDTTKDDTPDGFQVGGFTFKPGGRIHLAGIRDFNPIGDTQAFDVRTIPIDAGEGVNSNIFASQSRLNLDVTGDVEGHTLKMFVEGDFYGSSNAFRLRHAYGQYKWLLAGQTWTTFMDPDNIPNTIDFESPVGFALIRQGLIRWTQTFGSVTWSAAVEDNKSTIVVPDIPGEVQFPLPDFVTRFRFDMPAGHITASAFTGAAAFRRADEDLDEVALWGTALSAIFDTTTLDSIYAVGTFGDGIGRYRGGIAAVPDENNQLHAVRAWSFMGGYEHYWSERWSTNAVYSIAEAPEKPFYTDNNRTLVYGAVNLIYYFLGNRAWAGVEYLYGEREVFGPAPDRGHANRVNYAIRFNFP